MVKKLSQYSDTKKEVERLEERIARLENKLLSPRTSVISDMPKSLFRGSDQMLNNIILFDELKEKYVAQLMSLWNQQIEVETAIQELEPIERDLIRLRYFDNLPWWKISNELNYGQRQVFNIHNRALNKLKQKDCTPMHSKS